jgi:hypothetical protein
MIYLFKKSEHILQLYPEVQEPVWHILHLIFPPIDSPPSCFSCNCLFLLMDFSQGGQIRGQFAPLPKHKTVTSCFTTTSTSGMTSQACYLCGAGKGGPGANKCYITGSNMMPVTMEEAAMILDGVALAQAAGLY